MIVSGENVRKLFSQSSLKQAVLMQVWLSSLFFLTQLKIYELASSKQKGYMEKKEFFKALKMIGIY